MKNTVLEDIISYAQRKLTAAYGFAGVANGEESAMINSNDRDGKDIIIEIKVKDE